MNYSTAMNKFCNLMYCFDLERLVEIFENTYPLIPDKSPLESFARLQGERDKGDYSIS